MQTEPFASLPIPDALSAAHSARVAEHLRQSIAAADGIISFAQFMHEVLYAPGLGYYTAGSEKFGADGDFVTAPEVSPIFGKVLARQCEEVLRQTDRGELLEVGAGSGRLAVDLLVALHANDTLPARYTILEVSADLAERQRALLQREVPHLLEYVDWLSEFPKDHEGVIIANEVLDALPVERFVRRDSGVAQSCVCVESDALVWTERPAPERLANAVTDIESRLGLTLADGFTSEVSLAATAWTADLGRCLRHGAAFLFDYGLSTREYYAADRGSGWLRCHFRHHAHDDPLLLPGIQDVTAWVDFSQIAAAAAASGLSVLGYQTQSQFLMGGGLEQALEDFSDLTTAEQLKLSGQIKTLTLPGEMGENFKCLALGRGDVDAPSAFRFADRTHTL